MVRPYIGIKMLQLNETKAAQLRRADARFPRVSCGILVPQVSPIPKRAKNPPLFCTHVLLLLTRRLSAPVDHSNTPSSARMRSILSLAACQLACEKCSFCIGWVCWHV